MKRLFTTLLILTGFVLISYQGRSESEDVKKKTKTAEITFFQNDYDFGNITEGEVNSVTFKFQNSGRTPLIISNVITTCGCTITKWSKDPVGPGKYGTIVASFYTKGRIGKQHKVITILSNAINQKEEIYFDANILPKAIDTGIAQNIQIER